MMRTLSRERYVKFSRKGDAGFWIVVQLNSEETIENQLFSGDPRLMAWRAHAALVGHDGNLIPDLLSLASKWQSPPDRDTVGHRQN